MSDAAVGVVYIDEKGDTTLSSKGFGLSPFDQVTAGSSYTHSDQGGDFANAPATYDDKLLPASSYPWTGDNETAQATYMGGKDMDGKVFMVVGVLIVAWLLLVALVSMSIYYLWRRTQRRTASEKIVRSYLERYEDKDVRVLKSPPGGWNVTYKQRLANRVNCYWSRELPKVTATDNSTKTGSSQEDGILSTCSSLTESLGTMPLSPPQLKWTASRRSIETGTADLVSNQGRKMKYQPIGGRKHTQSTHAEKVMSFVKSNFAMQDVRLEESLRSKDGFSATFANRLAEGVNDFENGDETTIDFMPVGVDCDRTSSTRCLFCKVPCVCRTIDEEIGLAFQAAETFLQAKHPQPWDEISNTGIGKDEKMKPGAI